MFYCCDKRRSEGDKKTERYLQLLAVIAESKYDIGDLCTGLGQAISSSPEI